MTSITNPPSAQMTLDEAIASVWEHANEDWRAIALSKVRLLCETMHEFTTDDLAEELAKTMATTHEPRAVGAIMRKAAANGWCQKSTTFVKSRRKHCHGMDIPVWQSNLYSSTSSLS